MIMSAPELVGKNYDLITGFWILNELSVEAKISIKADS